MMKLFLPALVASSLLTAQSSYAEVIFSCNTDDNQQLQIQDRNGKITYKLGRELAKPDFELSIPRSEASTWQWNGVGREMSYSVTLPDGDTRYTAFFSVDRVSEEHPLTAGIIKRTTSPGDVVVRDFVARCDPETLFQSLEGIDLKPDSVD